MGGSRNALLGGCLEAFALHADQYPEIVNRSVATSYIRPNLTKKRRETKREANTSSRPRTNKLVRNSRVSGVSVTFQQPHHHPLARE